MSIPNLSVILTTHLRPKLLARSLESLLNQTDDNFQIILCSDEGSIETRDIANEYLRKNDCLLVLPHLVGPSSTRNEGLRIASGKKVIFLDDDDTFDIDFFENLNKSTCNTNHILHYFNYSKCQEVSIDGVKAIETVKHYQGNNKTEIMVGNFIPNNSFVVDSCIAKSVMFDVSLRSHEDWEYLISLNKMIKFAHIDIYGPNIYSSDNTSRNNDSYRNGSVMLDFLSIYRKHPSDDPRIKLARSQALASFGVQIPAELL